MKNYTFNLNSGKKLVCTITSNRNANFDLGDLDTLEQEHAYAENGKKYVLRDVHGRKVGFWQIA